MRDMAKFLDNALNTFLETLKNIMNHIKTWNDFRIYIPFKDKKKIKCAHILYSNCIENTYMGIFWLFSL